MFQRASDACCVRGHWHTRNALQEIGVEGPRTAQRRSGLESTAPCGSRIFRIHAPCVTSGRWGRSKGTRPPGARNLKNQSGKETNTVKSLPLFSYGAVFDDHGTSREGRGPSHRRPRKDTSSSGYLDAVWASGMKHPTGQRKRHWAEAEPAVTRNEVPEVRRQPEWLRPSTATETERYRQWLGGFTRPPGLPEASSLSWRFQESDCPVFSRGGRQQPPGQIAAGCNPAGVPYPEPVTQYRVLMQPRSERQHPIRRANHAPSLAPTTRISNRDAAMGYESHLATSEWRAEPDGGSTR